MSLTDHLDDPRSPVRRYLAAAFPDVAAVRRGGSSAIVSTPIIGTVVANTSPTGEGHRFVPGPTRVSPADPAGYPWFTSGTAWDYRLRFPAGRKLSRSFGLGGSDLAGGQ